MTYLDWNLALFSCELDFVECCRFVQGEKLHFHHIRLYEFRKGASVETATQKKKNIQKLYLNPAPVLRAVKINLSDCARVILTKTINHQSDVDEDSLPTIVENKPKFSTEECRKHSVFIDRSVELSVKIHKIFVLKRFFQKIRLQEILDKIPKGTRKKGLTINRKIGCMTTRKRNSLKQIEKFN